MKPSNNLTRAEKIKALLAIKEGKASIDILNPDKTYFFIQMCSDPIYYECEGKLYNEEEHAAKVQELGNIRSLTWKEERTPPRTITMKRQEGYPPEMWPDPPPRIQALIDEKYLRDIELKKQ